jgi:hypothetical protein
LPLYFIYQGVNKTHAKWEKIQKDYMQTRETLGTSWVKCFAPAMSQGLPTLILLIIALGMVLPVSSSRLDCYP